MLSKKVVTPAKAGAQCHCKGFRGKPPVDVETIERLLASLSQLAINHPEIKEMDVNPPLVHSEGQSATVADCRMMLFDGSEG
jgi:acetate---CoA ligase (ADP-forming)